MDANSSTILRFKEQANKFSGILSKGLSKTTQRLIKELVYGAQAAKDVKISNVARSLQEKVKLKIYLTRWKCDECYRFIKQSYNLEDIRVRSYNGIRNMSAIVHPIAYFTSIYMGMNLKLKVMFQKVFILSKRFFVSQLFIIMQWLMVF